MVESGQPPIVSVEFASRRHADLPLEVLERLGYSARTLSRNAGTTPARFREAAV